MAQDPNRFDEFVIESMIGEGGMGKVYRARQTALDRWVALKVLPRAKENRNFIERFYREARSAARLVHPNIIQIHTVGEVQGVPYFTMEYVEGDDLEHIIRMGDTPLDNDCIIEIARSVVKALAVASEQGVVHRDIKPANIMVSKTGLVKVMDFGLAKELDHSITQSGVVVGTPTYMSPEQGSGQPVDFRADLYSLGCVLYECIKGQPPFHAEKVASVIYKHMFEPPPPLSDAAHPVDANIEKFIMRMLAKKPDERYASTDAALEALAKTPFNSAAAEITLSKLAQKSLKAKRLLSQRSISRDPDAPQQLLAQQPTPAKLDSDAQTVDETIAHSEKTESPQMPAQSRIIPQVAPLGQLLAEKAKFLQQNLQPQPTEKLPVLPPSPSIADIRTGKPLAPPAHKDVGGTGKNHAIHGTGRNPVLGTGRNPPLTGTGKNQPLTGTGNHPPLPGTGKHPVMTSSGNVAESMKPPPKPLNMLKPMGKRESSGVHSPDGPKHAVKPIRPSSILDEAEVIHRNAAPPVMRVKVRPANVSPLFVKLPDGGWTYSKYAQYCERAEGLAKDLPSIPVPEGKDRGLGDCLLCPNWNKRIGCAAAYCEEMLVKGRFTGVKLLSEQAIAWIGAGRFDNAIALFNEFIEDNPNNPHGYRELARIYDRPDYKGRDKKRGIILYTRYIELAREQNEGSKIELARAEARANAMKMLPTSYGGAPMGEAIEFDCFYRGVTDCYVYCRLDLSNLTAVKAGTVDPITGVSEPDPNAGVSAFQRAKSMFARTKTEQEKQEDQSSVRKELVRLAELDNAMLKKETDLVCMISLVTLGAIEIQMRPPDLMIAKCTDKGNTHAFIFTGSNAFQGQQVREYFARRTMRRKT